MVSSSFRTLAALAVAVGLSGCASIFNGRTQAVGVSSSPPGAAFKVTNRAQETVHSGTTPATVTLNRGSGFFKPETYTVSFAKEGYLPTEATAAGTVSGWYAGNLIFGGLIGLVIVDPLTGGMYKLPETVSASLQSRGGSAPASANPATAGSPVRSATAGAQPMATRAVVSEDLGNGGSLFTVERMPEVRACTASPRAVLVAKGPGFETYAVSCQDGEALAVRCEFGNCRVLR